jgi:hypothetical protein
MEVLLKSLMRGAEIVLLKRLAFLIGEPVFWVICVGLAAIGGIGVFLETKKKKKIMESRSKKRSRPRTKTKTSSTRSATKT